MMMIGRFFGIFLHMVAVVAMAKLCRNHLADRPMCWGVCIAGLFVSTSDRNGDARCLKLIIVVRVANFRYCGLTLKPLSQSDGVDRVFVAAGRGKSDGRVLQRVITIHVTVVVLCCGGRDQGVGGLVKAASIRKSDRRILIALRRLSLSADFGLALLVVVAPFSGARYKRLRGFEFDFGVARYVWQIRTLLANMHSGLLLSGGRCSGAMTGRHLTHAVDRWD